MKSDTSRIRSAKLDSTLIKNGSVLWVIDMQNDFIDSVVSGLKGPFGIGAFAVAESNLIIEKMVSFINENKYKFSKIIFTRDWHNPTHCSFSEDEDNFEYGEGDGKYPSHCVYNDIGAAFNPIVKSTIESLISEDGDKIDILFKGYHTDTDSYSALQWPEMDDPMYIFKMRQLKEGTKSCCQLVNCANKTGGKKLKYQYINKQLDTEVFEAADITVDTQFINTKYFEDVYNIPEPTENGEVYVIGLAGEFCVKDTAINLSKFYQTKKKLVKVNVLQELTGYVFVPVRLSFQRYDYTSGDYLKYGEWKDQEKPYKLNEACFDAKPKSSDVIPKSLSLYLFEYNGTTGNIHILDPDELAILHENLNSAKSPSEYKAILSTTYWHFASDQRKLVDDYIHYNINLIMPPEK